MNARMLARSAERVLLVDSSKFGRASTYLVALLSACSHVVTDLEVSSDWRQRIANRGVALISVEKVVPDEVTA